MADFTSSPVAGGYDDANIHETASNTASNQLISFTNAAGALVSLALVVGIGIWGYKLLVRDVSGIPVVRAAEGDMRVRPEDPGGQLAQNQGLSVNAVAAEGAAAAPADQLRLAPRPVDLTAEDQIVPAAMVAPTPQVAAPATPDITAALQSGNVEELVAQLTDGIAPLTETPVTRDTSVAALVESAVAEALEDAPQPVTVAAAVLDAPGVRQSLRPQKRPSQRAQVVRVSASGVATNPALADVDAASVPVGTRLAQLGAFDSEAVAREQWDQLNTRFGTYLAGKKRVVQKATSGGRVFYRLRAMGFEDIADARRFCSALVAENADCIPVVTR
ncbi:SPOR domain-containing protein [Sulfitobacter sp. TSTF-M16]|uniref:SPOR domain-containing protein n=1 Tax=Sulfitobacter aestuariivivens TaxID=2766981 RepID=A0A927D1R3_9RHOB|nr:SPOR domain-containing protein [Sulfitobacter aestuariivivens]MBD3663440.1 SPOR domain-containing protein [Sulfitobacter aestuariivivens]